MTAIRENVNRESLHETILYLRFTGIIENSIFCIIIFLLLMFYTKYEIYFFKFLQSISNKCRFSVLM